MIDAGTAEPESDTETSYRHVLTNWIGGGSVEADVAHHRLADGDRLLLCTDGLTDLVSELEIAALLKRTPGLTMPARAWWIGPSNMAASTT